MADIKIYAKGNYVYILDSVSGLLKESPSTDIVVTRSELSSTTYNIRGSQEDMSYLNHSIGEIQDEAGSVYSDAAFRLWYQANTGGPTAGAGGSSSANQLLLIDALEIPTTIVDGSKDIAVTGTAIALGTTKTIKYAEVTAKIGNVGTVWVGGSGIGNGTNGTPLLPGESKPVYINNLAKIFVNGADTDGVTFTDYV